MASYQSRDDPTLCPDRYGKDGAGLFDWLPRAVGFAERMRAERADSTFGHAELGLAVAVLMLAYEDGHKG